MSLSSGLLLLVLSAPSLPDLLGKLGEHEVERETGPGCSYREVVTVEQLDKQGAPVAREIRTMESWQKGKKIQRKLVELRKELKPLDKVFAHRPEEEKEQPVLPGPFHPSEQPGYQFILKPENGQRATVEIRPIKKAKEKVRGVATVDLSSSRVTALELSPSELPTFLSSLKMQIELGSTACGEWARSFVMEGEGGFLFFKKRFRMRATYASHAPMQGP